MNLNNDKKVLIVGLGLIGGSYAIALKKKGFCVNAITKDDQDIVYAKEKHIIDDGITVPNKDYIENADVIIFALYPHIFLDWIKEYGKYIKSGTLVTDVTGVKGEIVEKVQSMLNSGVEFIASHPMAGREVYGVKNSTDEIFKGANFIVVPRPDNTFGAIEACKKLGKILGFSNISVITPEEHDKIIAFLSQLTHCIAVSLMCSSDNEHIVDYTGDSFRDLTRIARINEDMWSELFLLNKKALLEEMEAFETSFDKLKKALIKGDEQTMKEMMRLSTSRRKQFDK